MKGLLAAYPDPKDLVSSTAAARLNGYLGGHGTFAGLAAEIDGFGLAPEGRKTLLAIVRGPECPPLECPRNVPLWNVPGESVSGNGIGI
ncbi:MAG: hypothetical protein ACXW4I_10240 [Candidatus Deferrimicrobiaceae bacterium]